MFKALFQLFSSKKPSAAAEPGSALARSMGKPAEAVPPAAPSAPPPRPELPRRDPNASPEELCGISPEMTADEIHGQLAALYQRHNRAASSFDPALREEAEFMLETLAGLREKYFGPPG